jgi:biofilm PGA synthesis N-glycosyltransferase PgaC
METSALLYYMFGIVSTVFVAHLGFYLTGASFYDIWQFRRHKQHSRQQARSGRRALVSVLVPAHNESMVIIRCLESIRHNTYQNKEIIVVDDASTDETSLLVEQYAERHPDVCLKLVTEPVNVGKGRALNHALRTYAKGKYAMTVDADSVLAPNTIGRAVRYFDDPAIAGVAANVQLMNQFTLLGVLQKFEHMIGYRSKKVYSITNCEFVIGGVASTYRMDILRKVGYYDVDTLTEDIGLSMKVITNGNRANRIVYGADVVAMTEPVETFRALLRQRFRWKYGSLQNICKHYHLIGANDIRYTRMLTLYRMPMAIIGEIALLVAPLIWTYIIYITISSRSLVLLVGAYTTITLYTFITLWFDEHLNFRDRLHLTVYLPLVYFIFYIMDFIQLVAVLRCAFRAHQLVRLQNVGTTWISPPRQGQEMSVSFDGQING